MRGQTNKILKLLRQYESQNVTFLDPDGSWPIVWSRAKGNYVWDAEGKRYLDLTAAFGVTAAGHANTRVVRAGQQQMETLLHAMGDVHPHALKAKLAKELSQLTFERWAKLNFASGPTRLRGEAARGPIHGKTIFCNSGFEAVEASLKTALLATGKPGIIAFEGAYHGLGYGSLNATHREHFRKRFKSQLGGFSTFVPFPTEKALIKSTLAHIRTLLKEKEIGAVLLEPIQTRGGINIAPEKFLRALRRLCAESGTLLILDEIYTGFGRTGKWFACDHARIAPDLICLGKALTGGFPLAACVGSAVLMDQAWPKSDGEAIHTSTYLGHPVGCAMALAQIREIKRLRLIERGEKMGRILSEALTCLAAEISGPITLKVRSVGLLAGLELRLKSGTPATKEVIEVVKHLLLSGFILLPEGAEGNVISITPPLTIGKHHLLKTVCVLKDSLNCLKERLELGRYSATKVSQSALASLEATDAESHFAAESGNNRASSD